MYPKLPVFKYSNVLLKPVRRNYSLTQLERFEKLRSMWCISEKEKRRMEAEAILGPKTREPEGSIPVGCCSPCEADCMELMDVKCKTAMVVGGASGMGYEICSALLKAGALKVCIVDCRQDRALAAVEKLNQGSSEPRACPILTDIRSDCEYDAAFREALRCFCQIDIFVNCVGVFDETPECWDQMIDLNLVGTIRGTLLAYQYLSQNTRENTSQGAVILNVSSYAAIANVPSMPLFSAASNGIIGLTSSFGQDFHFCNSGVRFLTLCPACNPQGMFKNMNKYHYRPEWVSHSVRAMKCKQKQSPKDVAKAIIHTIRFGLNGNVYVIMGGKYYRYLMPDYRKIVRREAYMM